jgi:energy-coupling factor transporter ATP-binding protein EcfA2
MIDLGSMILASSAAAAGTVPFIVRSLCAPPTDVSLEDSRRTEIGIVDHLPFERLLAPSLMRLSYGAYLVTYEVIYSDTSVMTDQDRIGHCAWIADAMHKIGKKVAEDEGWMWQQHELCVPADPLEMPAFVANDGARVLAQSHLDYVNPSRQAFRDYLSFTYAPPGLKSDILRDIVSTGPPKIESGEAKNIAEFEKGLAMVEDSLRHVSRLRRLGTHPKDPARSEFLETLFEIEFDDPQPIFIGTPFEPFDCGGLLGAREFSPAGIEPKLGDKHVRVLSVFDHPRMMNPALFDAFKATARPGCRFASRMIFQESELMKKALIAKKRKLTGKKTSLVQAAMPGSQVTKPDRVADYQEKKVDDQIFNTGTNPISWVYYAVSVVIFNEDLEILNENVRAMRKALQGAGFTVNLETMNTIDAYLGHIPGDGIHNVCEGLAHTVNASRGPSNSRWHGRKMWTCKFCGPNPTPALRAVSDCGEDFFVDPHDDQDRQSLLILGDSGSGKTTLINAFSADYIREPTDQSFGFDCNLSQFVTCKFLSGVYHERLTHWLFDDLENPDKRQFLAHFFSWLVELNGGRVDDRAPILDAMKKMLEEKVWNRTLSSFVGLLAPYDKGGRIVQAVKEYDVDGVHRGLLAGTPRTSADARVRNAREVFELGYLLGGGASERAAAPAFIFLIKSIEDRLPGHRSMLWFDEAWAGLNAPGVAPLLEKLLLTIRARHGGIGMAAQNPDHILKSPIGRTIKAVSESALLLPNNDIPDRLNDKGERDGTIRDVYAFDFGLNDAQIGALKAGVKKRDCALLSSGKFGMFRLALSPAEEAIFGCTGRDEVADVKALIEDDETTWREEHFRKRGCTKEAQAMRSLRLHNHLTPIAIRETLRTL